MFSENENESKNNLTKSFWNWIWNFLATIMKENWFLHLGVRFQHFARRRRTRASHSTVNLRRSWRKLTSTPFTKTSRVISAKLVTGSGRESLNLWRHFRSDPFLLTSAAETENIWETRILRRWDFTELKCSSTFQANIQWQHGIIIIFKATKFRSHKDSIII